MQKIVLNVDDSVYLKMNCLCLQHEKSLSDILTDIFESDEKAQSLYDTIYQEEFNKITREEI